MGFDHGWTFDHITWSGLPDSPWFAAVPTLTAAAVVTSRIRLGTFVSSPNNHHPVQFMREVLALDDISDGRLLLGLGTGGDLDSRITGADLPLRDRLARFHELTDLLDRLLSADNPVSADGRFYSARDVSTLPGPVRGEATGNRVPFVVAANGPKSMRLAVERGDAWMTYGGPADTDADWWALLARHSRTIDELLAESGRDGAGFDRYLNIDAGPSFSLASVDAFEQAVGRADELGFTDVITHWPRSGDPYGGRRDVLDAVVADVLPRWRAAAEPPGDAG